MRNSLIASLVILLMVSICSVVYSQDTDADNSKLIERIDGFFSTVGWNPNEAEPSIKDAGSYRTNALEVSVGELTVEIDPASGRVLSGMNKSLVERQFRGVINLSEADAYMNAVNFLQAAGIPTDDIKLISNKIEGIIQAESYAKWVVRFGRVYNEFSFYGNDFIYMALDPEDGIVASFGYNFNSPLPESTRVKIDEEYAEQRAKDYLSGMEYKAGNTKSKQLMIVQPDDYWEYLGTGQMPPSPTSSRLAWVVTFDAPWSITEVWVDSANGNILGGAKSLSIEKSVTKPISFKGITKITATSADGSKPIKISPKSNKMRQVIDQFYKLPRTEAKVSSFDRTIDFKCKERSYSFGYSAKEHLFVMLQKEFGGEKITCNSAWKTTTQFESLVKQLTGMETK